MVTRTNSSRVLQVSVGLIFRVLVSDLTSLGGTELEMETYLGSSFVSILTSPLPCEAERQWMSTLPDELRTLTDNISRMPCERSLNCAGNTSRLKSFILSPNRTEHLLVAQGPGALMLVVCGDAIISHAALAQDSACRMLGDYRLASPPIQRAL